MRYPLDWNDLRYFLAVARTGTLSAASRELKVDAGTVSRRVLAMETALGARCFERRPDGYPLTEQGALLLEHAERVEQEIVSLDRAVDAGDKQVSGLVAITAVESVSHGFLLPALTTLKAIHPNLRIDLVVDNRVLSLGRREVDIALRMARAEQGELLSRRIGVMGFGLYASREYLDAHGVPDQVEDLARHSLIDYLGEYPRSPPAAWFREITSRFPAFLKSAARPTGRAPRSSASA